MSKKKKKFIIILKDILKGEYIIQKGIQDIYFSNLYKISLVIDIDLKY